jgi:CRISPR-associated protein Csd1
VADFFSEPPKDDPDRGGEAVRLLHESVQKGSYAVSDKDTRFYVLGLAPNAKRISVRFWHVGTVPEMAARFDQHFQDIAIAHGQRDKDALSLFRLLVATAGQGKSENIPPNLAGDTMRAILEGTPYPATLLQAAVRRNRAEQEVTYPRAAIIKASLNRMLRFNNPTQEKEITMSLDPANNNIGYRLGRLFAALEKVQSDANPGLNATIRDRFYGAASSTPVTVFGNLLRLSQHHLSKLSDGLRITREREIQEIMAEIGDFPAHLHMADQGRFAIGYYHQMQDFFTKKADKE